MVKTLCFHCKGHGVDPWWGKFLPQVMAEKREPKKKKSKKKNIYTCDKCHQEKTLYLLGSRSFVQGESEAV